MTTKTAFISYSHDSTEHSKRVLSLAFALRDNGIDVELASAYTNKGAAPLCREPRHVLDFPRTADNAALLPAAAQDVLIILGIASTFLEDPAITEELKQIALREMATTFQLIHDLDAAHAIPFTRN